MSHSGALKKVESEEREERGSGRSQNVVHTLPRSMASVPKFLTGPLERVDPAEGTTQLLVITADAETALAMAEAVLRLTGPAGIELLPVTSARRASRLMAGRPVLAAAGSPADLRDLVRGSHIKLDQVTAVVLAWADEILASGQDVVDALEGIMGELPKDAARIVVTSRSEGRVNAFAERYLRRARREAEPDSAEATDGVAFQYVTVSRASRATSLRRLLDDLDPPSVAIIVDNDESDAAVRAMLRTLGYPDSSDTVRVTRSEIAPSTHAVIFFDAPTSQSLQTTVKNAGAVTVVALVEPREVEALKRISPDARPYSLKGSLDAARGKEAAVRRELANVLEQGVGSREVLALEPLLERYDGIEVAAAALRLLEKERTLRAADAEARRPAPTERDRDRGDRGDRGDRDRRPAFGKREGPPRKFDRDQPGKFDRGAPRKFDRDRPPRRDDRGGPPRRGRQ
jgi:ATP-dependent RNA helicase DeaD